jgi:DNA-binding CsgD family transcriptional regulator
MRCAIAVYRGELEQAARYLEVSRGISGHHFDVQQKLMLTLREIELQHARGDLAAARAGVQRAVEKPEGLLARVGWPLVGLGLRIEADAATLARDRRDRAQVQAALARAGDLERFAEGLEVGNPAARAYARLAVAERARVAGEPSPEAWQAAVEAWRAAGEPHPLAYSVLRLAEVQLAAGDRAAAGESVREAAEIARTLGAQPLVAEAEALARRGRLEIDGDRAGAGTAAGARDPADRFGLTDREREVLRLVADGRSNPQIAAELYISPKTASVHVSNILGKLGVSGRVEAAAVAHRLGLTATGNTPE